MVTLRYRLLVWISAVFLVYLSFPWLYHLGDYVRQTNPWSGQKYIELAFTADKSELACLHGTSNAATASSHDDSDVATTTAPDPIPNIVHFIFGLKNPLESSRAGHFDFLCYLAVRSAIVSLRPDAIYLHYTYLPAPASYSPAADPASTPTKSSSSSSSSSNSDTDTDAATNDPLANPWIARLSKHIKLVYHPPNPSSSIQYAHLSDTMRLEFLQSQGGIYLDMDSFALRSFDSLRHPPRGKDVILGHEGGNRWGLCNAVMAARPNSTFVARWLRSYDSVDFSREWNYHSVLLPKEMAAAHPDEVCALAPDAFFWPTWTWRHVGWMHEALGRAETEVWRAEIDKNGGSLFANQVAYHAWSQMAWDRYLKGLTPEVVRMRDTRFNLLMRRFMEDDL